MKRTIIRVILIVLHWLWLWEVSCTGVLDGSYKSSAKLLEGEKVLSSVLLKNDSSVHRKAVMKMVVIVLRPTDDRLDFCPTDTF